LSRHVKSSDFKRDPSLLVPSNKANLIKAAYELGSAGFSSLSLTPQNVGGRTVFQLAKLEEELVLRKAAQNLRMISSVRQADRVSIIKRLRLLCEEGVSFNIQKLDIKSFFPSIDVEELNKEMSGSLATSPASRKVLGTFLHECSRSGAKGIPPGLPISAPLSEFYMRSFDRKIRTMHGVHFFARYVDDAICVLDPQHNRIAFKKEIVSKLPQGLSLNSRKTKFYEFGPFNRAQKDKLEQVFDYLGYSFSVYTIDNAKSGSRRVELDISPSKVKTRKTRFILSLRQYLADGNFDDLVDRTKILTCNYKFYDEKDGKQRHAGNRHTYSLISRPSPSLKELDQFKSKVLLSGVGKTSGPLRLSLSNAQRKELMRYSFEAGFENGVHFSFKPDDLERLIRCWKYA